MKRFSKFITESFESFLKLTPQDKQKLLDLDLEYGKTSLIARYETVVRGFDNKDEEFEKFQKRYILGGEKYFPEFHHKRLRYDEYDLKKRCSDLIGEFKSLNCYLSQFYIAELKSIINNIDKWENSLEDSRDWVFDEKMVKKALKIIKTHPYHQENSGEYEKNISSEEAAKIIKSKLKELGYDWKIVMKENMPPRMGVNPEKTFRIKKEAKFSKKDIESLIAHEIKGHVARRYYGYQTGLFLFVFGLEGKNLLDEGMAIWNTFNLLDEPKPNSLFNIAMSYLVCYYCSQYDFCEAFDKIRALVPEKDYSDKRIFSSLARAKRACVSTQDLGFWKGDTDYFLGYLAVDSMTDEEREDILKYNIGLDQIHEIDTIKKFIEINKLKPITNSRLEQIKKDYDPEN